MDKENDAVKIKVSSIDKKFDSVVKSRKLSNSIFVFACRKHRDYLRKSRATLSIVKQLIPEYRRICFISSCNELVAAFGMLENVYIKLNIEE